jgi:hypothetical protein
MGVISIGEASRFSSTQQPDKKKVGRPKNIFGPLAKANNLSNDDVKKIFKNILSSRPEDINKVIEKYPTVLTVATANILAQEMRGELTGKWELTGRKIPKIGADGKPVLDKKGKPTMIDEMRPERCRSYDIVKYMLERCFGKPTQKDIVEFHDIPDSAKDRLNQIFEDVQKKSEKSEKSKPKTGPKKTKGKKAEE